MDFDENRWKLFLQASRTVLSRPNLKKIGLPEVYLDPGRFKKLREACRNNFHLFSCKLDLMVPSYDQKIKNLGFLMDLLTLNGFKSSGRPVGTIST